MTCLCPSSLLPLLPPHPRSDSRVSWSSSTPPWRTWCTWETTTCGHSTVSAPPPPIVLAPRTRRSHPHTLPPPSLTLMLRLRTPGAPRDPGPGPAGPRDPSYTHFDVSPRCCTVSPLPHPGPPLHRQLHPDPRTPLPSTHLQLSPWLPLSADSHPLPLFPTSSSIHPRPPAPISRGQSALCGMDKPGTLSCHPTPPLLGLQSPRTTDLSPRHPHPHVACLYTCASGVGHTWPHDTPGHALLRATQTRPRQTQPRQGAGCSCPRPRPHRESPLPSPPSPPSPSPPPASAPFLSHTPVPEPTVSPAHALLMGSSSLAGGGHPEEGAGPDASRSP